MHPLLQKLAAGDPRSLGASDEVAAEAEADPALLEPLLEGLGAADAVLRLRAADALEKATRQHPERLAPFAGALLGAAGRATQAGLRWHLAVLLPRLPLDTAGRARAVALLIGYLADADRLVQVHALQGLAGLAVTDAALRVDVRALLDARLAAPSPAVRARARKLLAALDAA